MIVMDLQSAAHLVENVQVQLGEIAFQIWFVFVTADQPTLPGRLLNQVQVGTKRRDDEFVKGIFLTVYLHSNHLTGCWMSYMMSVDQRTERNQESVRFLV